MTTAIVTCKKDKTEPEPEIEPNSLEIKGTIINNTSDFDIANVEARFFFRQNNGYMSAFQFRPDFSKYENMIALLKRVGTLHMYEEII